MKKAKEKSTLSFMDKLIVSIFIGVVLFIIAMIVTFCLTGTEQTTLITSVFALVTAEMAFCWRIKAAKLKGAKDPLEEAVKQTYKDEEEEDDAGCSDADY